MAIAPSAPSAPSATTPPASDARAGRVLAFAEHELARFLAPVTLATGRGPAVALRIDDHAGAACRIAADAATIAISGASAGDVLHACYRYLEHLGYVFTVSGARAPDRLPETLPQVAETIVPAVARRGIRQHVNFPMDVSSYPLDEAREYLRNLARMKFNTIVFHLYEACGWFHIQHAGYAPVATTRPGKSPITTCFYSDVHPVPADLLASVRNRAVFFRPEDEDGYGTEEGRRRNYAFLRALIHEAQRCGLHVVLSAEAFSDAAAGCFASGPVDDARCVAATAAILRELARLYPEADEVELISRENCCSEDRDPDAACAARIAQLCPDLSAAAVRDRVRALRRDVERERPSDHWLSVDRIVSSVPLALQAVAVSLQAFAAVDDDPEVGTWYRARRRAIGLYLGHHGVVAETARVLAAAVPRDIGLSWIPGHGAAKVEAGLAAMPLDDADRARLRAYSWVELDGYMYTLQFPRTGIEANVARARSVDGGRGGALLWHHWRSAENELGLLHAATMAWHGIDADAVRRDHVAALWGLDDGPDLAAYLDLLERLNDDSIATDAACGFCFFGCWWNLDRDKLMSWVQHVTPEGVAHCRGLIAAARSQLRLLARRARGSEGRRRLLVQDVFLEASDAHLRCTRELARMRADLLAVPPARRGADDRERFQQLGDAALAEAEAWLAAMRRGVVDRGVEGSLVSYVQTVVRYIRAFQGLYGESDFDPYAGRQQLAACLQAPPLMTL